jgi:hypothetical protein
VTLTNPSAPLPDLISFICFDCMTTFDMSLAVPSPTDQGCTPDGGVSANRTDVNSTGGANE